VRPEKKFAAVLIGPAGSGKTTLARALSGPEVAVIETGNLLEAEVRHQSPLGRQIKPYKVAGELVPSDLVNQVISAELKRFEGRLVLFDGFPRSLEQVDAQLQLLKAHDRKLCAVIVLTLDLAVSIRRLSGRRICAQCGALYNVWSNPPCRDGACDKCGGQLVQRGDDREELVRHRFKTYERETVPAIEFYRREYPHLITEQSADAQPAEVLARVRGCLKIG
jgi:adenylate kinase